MGNRNSIRVWHDNWLLDGPSPKPLVQKILLANARVSIFIDHDLKYWNKNLVNEVFLPFEAEQILHIPISPRLPPDLHFWRLEKRGNFSVRSGYHLARSLSKENSSNPSTSAAPHAGWKALWHLHVAPKIKHFLWKFLSGTLPTFEAVARHGVSCNTLCLCC